MEEMRAKLVEAESRLGVMEDAERAAGERRGGTDGGGTRGDARARLFGEKGAGKETARNSRGRKPLQLSPMANGARGRGGTERRPRSTGARGATRRERELEQTVEKLRMVLETKQNALKQKDTVATRMSDALRQNRRLKTKLEDAETLVERGEQALEAKAKLVR